MRHISTVVNILKQHFSIDKRLLNSLVLMLSSLLQMRTVNIKLLAQAMANNIKIDSAYGKLQRLISKLSINILHLSALMLSWFYEKNEKFYLTIDRTQWELGKSKINFLVVAIPYKRMAIPLFWVLLSKKGNSNYK